MTTKNKIAVIRKDERDWTPIVAVLLCPKTPALSTMVKRFHEAFDFYVWDGHIPDTGSTPGAGAAKIVSRIHQDHNALEKAKAQGYVGHCEAELFVDWLIKQDAGFELMNYQEISI